MSSIDVQVARAELYNDLVEDGYDPLTVAATFMVTALTVYAKQLSPQSYTEVVDKIFSTADRFIDQSNRVLH